jgi:prevent-host-death family protein
MRVIGLKALKNKLSEYIRIAAAGERVLVTDRDRVVAEIVPPQSAIELGSDALLADAIRNGWLRPPLVRSHEPPSRLPIALLSDLLNELAADREER